jgi:two-component system, chemotaxis family, chemotaxis protein CheY
MSLNLMVVDDSAVVRAMIIKTLNLAGIPVGEIHQAGNGQEGLDLLADKWIDLVLVDINMPVMNGEEMLQSLRGNPEWEDLPVIIVSTEGSETRINGMMDANTRFVHKPFTPEQIRSVVTEMIGVLNERS